MESSSLDKLFLAAELEEVLSKTPETVAASPQEHFAHPRRIRQSSSLDAMLSFPPETNKDQNLEEKCEGKTLNDLEEESFDTMEKIRIWRRMRRQIIRKLATPEVSRDVANLPSSPTAHAPVPKIIYSSTTADSNPKTMQDSKMIVVQVGLDVMPSMRNVSSAQTA
jgi:hypothetical protein